MAGDAAIVTPWPHGNYMSVMLGPVSWPLLVASDDSNGYVKICAWKAPFAVTVKKAYFYMCEGSWVDGAGNAILVKVHDDDSQEIIAPVTVSTAYDAGTVTELTVVTAAATVQNNATVWLSLDNDDNGELTGLSVQLWVAPTYANVPDGTI